MEDGGRRMEEQQMEDFVVVHDEIGGTNDADTGGGDRRSEIGRGDDDDDSESRSRRSNDEEEEAEEDDEEDGEEVEVADNDVDDGTTTAAGGRGYTIVDARPDGSVRIHTNSLREAAAHLEDTRGVPIEAIEVAGSTRTSISRADHGAAAAVRADAALQFRRLVAALGGGGGRRRGEGGQWQQGAVGSDDGEFRGRVVRGIKLVAIHWESFPADDVERLCRDVLPHHPTLEMLDIAVPPPYLTILVNALRTNSNATESTSPLRELRFRGFHDHAAVESIVDLISRNTPITNLIVSSSPLGPAMDSNDGKMIFQAVARNTNLRSVDLHLKDVHVDTLDSIIMDPSSTLRDLHVSAERFTNEFMPRFAFQMRTNTTLEHVSLLHLGDGSNKRWFASPFVRAFSAVLETYNVTLQSTRFYENDDWILRKYTHRNEHLQRAIRQLEPRNYDISPPSLWPRAFGMVSGIPTLLYRFIRRGNVNALCDVVRRRQLSNQTQSGSGSERRMYPA